MERKDFYLAIVDYLETNIVAKIKEGKRFMLAGLLVIIPKAIDVYINNHQEMMNMLGIIDDNGLISVSGIRRFLENGFKSQPSVLVNFRKIIEMLVPACPPVILDLLDIDTTFTQKDMNEFMKKLGE